MPLFEHVHTPPSNGQGVSSHQRRVSSQDGTASSRPCSACLELVTLAQIRVGWCAGTTKKLKLEEGGTFPLCALQVSPHADSHHTSPLLMLHFT